MAKYFSFQELIRSRTAVEKRIDNTPPPTAKAALAALVNNLLDPVRSMWGAPIIVNSGFRSPVLNRAVGGAANSQHIKGEAADITTGSREGNIRLFGMIVENNLEFDQLIDEKDYSWLHISYRAGRNRRNILHL